MSPEPTVAVASPVATATTDAAPAAFRPVALPAVAGHVRSDESERARTAGYAAGWAAGARAAAQAAEAQARRVEELAARAEAERQAALVDALRVLERAVVAAAGRTVPTVEEARRTVLEAGLSLAEAVLARELSPGPRSARAVLERALDVPADLGVQTVRLNPADLAAVEALLADHAQLLPAGVRLVGDPRLAPGDAISEHPAGFLDGQVATALARARAALLEEEL